MRIRFWGVRGSIPVPGAHTVGFGGNTACIELRIGEKGRLIVIDAGSGIRSLGADLMAGDCRRGPLNADLFLTHTHQDHILGLPFFAPLYLPSTRLTIHGPATFEDNSLEDVIGTTFHYHFFPVRRDELASHLSFDHLKEGAYDLGDGIVLQTKHLNHPVTCLGYRFTAGDRSLCTVYDTEPFRNLFSLADPDDPSRDVDACREGEDVAREANRAVAHFLAGADLLIHDAQYTEAEYLSSRIGWGHSAMEQVIRTAGENGVKRLALFHHDPERTDGAIRQMEARFGDRGRHEGMEVFFAREGMEVVL